ncbi:MULTISPECIES: dihydrofolate reductase family protein [Microbacterium]|uniref:dihydrofolate reductase family protein n=1 Tax=Microbacterium barkeri TaxID=33917 RepID=UPI0024AF2CC2|nr:dihydrofolate reductase family protein [Microbacterium barkeri]MDI6944423.1 dihydrofolate reductase family protein [Microbacterium barkeri]
MSKVIAAISMSLDGFVTGPDVSREQQLGTGGMALHRWVHAPDEHDVELLGRMAGAAGAVLMGRTSYDLAEGDGGWGDGGPVGAVPCFVLTHEAPDLETVRARDVFTFVTDGLGSAVAQAREVAGERAVAVHGASATQQCLAAGILDEIWIHLAPLLLGEGVRLFEHVGGQHELERVDVIPSSTATHLHYRVIR